MIVCEAPYVVDGDTIRCGTTRIRLLGIDAPETHGCRPGRICTPGDGYASKRVMAALVAPGQNASAIIAANPGKVRQAHRAIYERKPQRESYDDMMTRIHGRSWND